MAQGIPVHSEEFLLEGARGQPKAGTLVQYTSKPHSPSGPVLPKPLAAHHFKLLRALPSDYFCLHTLTSTGKLSFALQGTPGQRPLISTVATPLPAECLLSAECWMSETDDGTPHPSP